MRILLVDLERAWRGGQSQALLLLRGLRERGHVVELVAASGSALAERAGRAGITVHDTAAKDRRWGAARLVRRLLREQRFDIVHANEAHALTAAWLARAHRAAPLVAARRVTFPLSRGYLSLARYRAAACVVAISHAVRKQLLAARLDPQRIAIVADGVEVPPPVSSEQRRSARERWNFAAGEQVLALVAPLTAEKGHALLLDAFAAIRREAPHCRLLLAGDGPLRAQARRAGARGASGLPDVRFAGFVEDVDSVYCGVRCVSFPVAQRRRRHITAERHGARLAGGGSGTRRRDGNCGERLERLACAGSLARRAGRGGDAPARRSASWRGNWAKRRDRPSSRNFPPIAWWRRRSLSSSA